MGFANEKAFGGFCLNSLELVALPPPLAVMREIAMMQAS
jgi:hypothetical protein